jgi:hypothetical protein
MNIKLQRVNNCSARRVFTPEMKTVVLMTYHDNQFCTVVVYFYKGKGYGMIKLTVSLINEAPCHEDD